MSAVPRHGRQPVSTEMHRSRLRSPSNQCLSKQEHPDGHKNNRLQSRRAPDATLRTRDLDNLSLPPQGTGEVPPTLPAEHSQHLLENYRTNISVVQEAKTTSVETTIIKNQLRWIGHVVRMPDSRLPKQIFCCQLKVRKRSRRGQKKRYKGLLKANLKKCNIRVSTWETEAKDRPTCMETDHRRKNFYLRSQPMCGI